MLDQYKKAIEIAQMGLWSWNPVTNEVNWSDEKFVLFGYRPREFEINIETAFKTVHPEDIEFISEFLEKNLTQENCFEYSYRGIKKDGELIYIWTRVQVDRDESGHPMMVHGISQDRTKQNEIETKVRWLNENLEGRITESDEKLLRQNDQNEFLVKEMHHRVKNNLQVISSILNLQKSHIKDKEAENALDLCVKRIKSMAIIHDSLYRHENLSQIGLEKYVNELINVHRTDKEIEFSIHIDNKELGLDLMVPIGLILNELIANSCLHAFSDVKNAVITIKIKFRKGIILFYKDNGSGINKDDLNEKPSFGMEMIKTLCEGLEGEYTITSSPNEGFLFKLIVPEDELAVQD
jgi:two-component sensor histidine kinase